MSGTEKLVTLKRLTAMLDAYGAEPDRWPSEERAAAHALIDGSAEARALFDRAHALDALLDRAEKPRVSPALARKVRAIQLPTHGSRLGNVFAGIVEWLHPGSRSAWQGVVAAAAVLGIATGVGLSEIVFDRPATTSGATVAARTTTDAAMTDTATADNGSAGPLIVWYEDGASDDGPATTASLEPDITQISLTGDDGANSGPIVQADDSEMAVASIPLY